MPAAPRIYSGRSARMSANGMHGLFETFFWTGRGSLLDVSEVRTRRSGHECVAENVKERGRVVLQERARGIESQRLGARQGAAVDEGAGGIRFVVDAVGSRAEHRDAGCFRDLAGRRERDLAVASTASAALRSEEH